MKPQRISWPALTGKFDLPLEEDKEETNRRSGLAYAAAFALFAGVVSGLLLGWLLDRWLGTSPWLLVSGIILGAGAGFYELVRTVAKIS